MKSKAYNHKKSKDSLGFALWQAHNQWHKEIQKCLKPFDLTHSQFIHLAATHHLISKGKSINQLGLTKFIDTEKMLTSSILTSLDKEGFILRKKDPNDGRSKIILITPKGKEVIKPAIKAVKKFDEQYFAIIKKPKKFNKALNRLIIPT